ncbi:RNA binding protein, heterogenous nuclear RNP-K like protein [Batrachochytrium dendrobatidis]
MSQLSPIIHSMTTMSVNSKATVSKSVPASGMIATAPSTTGSPLPVSGLVTVDPVAHDSAGAYTDMDETDAAETVPEMTLRSLVSTKEAGVVIGKGGASVANVRQIASVKVGVSKVVPSVSERILTVVGPLPNVAKAYALIAKNLLESTQTITSNGNLDSTEESTAIRLLVAHQLIGSIIGKAGAKIREIQEASGAKIVVSKEMMPQSTERVVEIYGLVDAIHIAIYHIGVCMKSDNERAAGIIPYDPQNSLRYDSSPFSSSAIISTSRSTGRNSLTNGSTDRSQREYREPRDFSHIAIGRRHSSNNSSVSSNSIRAMSGSTFGGAPASSTENPDTRTCVMTVQSDMIGCLMGKGGSHITQIRRLSGAKLHVAEQVSGRNDREITIVGTDEANRKAMSLLYNKLEAEKGRRLSQTSQAVEDHTNLQR